MPHTKTARSYRWSDETLGRLAEIRAAQADLTGIEPTETAVLELAVERLWRETIGRRHADRVPVRRGVVGSEEHSDHEPRRTARRPTTAP